MAEQWRDIPGWEGLYQASSHGRIRSVDRVVVGKDGVTQRRKGRIRKPFLHTSGYLYVTLNRDARLFPRKVHRLVLEAFTGPCPDGMEARHLDGEATNNAAENLAWAGHATNIQDKDKHGTSTADLLASGVHPFAFREECPRGHPLEQPNLVPSSLRRGARQCLACQRTHSYVNNTKARKGVDLSGRFAQIADEKYEQIVGAAALQEA